MNHTANYQVQLKVSSATEKAVACISEVNAWWAQEVEGTAQKTGDEFTVHFGKTWATFRVDELTTEHIVWAVTDCYLDLLEDTKEWNGTRLVFELSGHAPTLIDITHEGLTPAKQCFEDCQKGWDFYFKESLQSYLEKAQGSPGAGIHAWLEIAGQVYKGKLYSAEQRADEMSGDLLLLDVKRTKGEQVLSAHSIRPFNDETGALNGSYYMLLKNEQGLLEQLQLWQTSGIY